MTDKKTVPAWHWIHRWTPWEIRDCEIGGSFGIAVRTVARQSRQCVRCGRIELDGFL